MADLINCFLYIIDRYYFRYPTKLFIKQNIIFFIKGAKQAVHLLMDEWINGNVTYNANGKCVTVIYVTLFSCRTVKRIP